MSRTIKIEATKRGFPAMWETGGGLTSGGSATIIAKPDGSKPRAVFVRTSGHLSGGPHALVCVHEGYYLIYTGVGRGVRQAARIERIVGTSCADINGEKFEATAEIEEVNVFSRGEWDNPLDPKLEAAVEASFRKASIYHCRQAVYIDTELKAETAAQRQRREVEMAKQDAERARLRAEKAAADTKAKAEAEAASREAKKDGLGARLEAAQVRLSALKSSNPGTSYSKLELGESYFLLGRGDKLYAEANVADVERNVAYWEEQVVEKLRKQMARAEFQPHYEALSQRVENLGLTLSFGDEEANWEGGSYYGGFAYTQEGLKAFGADLVREEEQAAEKAREQAAVDAKAKAEAEAAELGLPSDVRIRRHKGVTNAGDGWVVRPDGSQREHDPCHLNRYGGGELVWNQLMPGELALQYNQASRYATPRCEVVYRPKTIMPAQLAMVKQLEEELGAADNAFGLDEQLGELLDSRAQAIEEAMLGLPELLWPDDGWTLEFLASKNGITLPAKAESWIKHDEAFEVRCNGREAQVAYELPAADGKLQVIAYYKFGRWNLNMWWREADVRPAPVTAPEPTYAEPAHEGEVTAETLEALRQRFS